MLLELLAVVVVCSGSWAKRDFAWSSCGSADDRIELVTLDVAPSPLLFGRNLSLSAHAVVLGQVTSLTADILSEKRIGPFYMSVVNVCELLSNVSHGEFGCPLATGPYSTDGPAELLALPTPQQSQRSFAEGDYRSRVTLRDADGVQLACIVVEFSLQFPS
eukprot:m51a1_g7220 hypothetical protein (161) ;mRNA; r:4471-5068